MFFLLRKDLISNTMHKVALFVGPIFEQKHRVVPGETL